jgi:hypothetical protein
MHSQILHGIFTRASTPGQNPPMVHADPQATTEHDMRQAGKRGSGMILIRRSASSGVEVPTVQEGGSGPGRHQINN